MVQGDNSMKSRDMADYGFVHWVPFNRSNVRELLERTPEGPGVYVIRRATPVTRRSGESDIVYIGSAANERGLRTRLPHYFHPGPTQRTNRRILTLMEDARDFVVSFSV